MSETQKIGAGLCPVCNSGKAQYSVTKKQLVCVTCNACNFQGFARSDRSDELLRAKIKAAPVQPDTAEPVREKAPAAAPGAPVPAARTAPPPPPAPKRESLMSW